MSEPEPFDDPELRAIFAAEAARHIQSLSDAEVGRPQWQRVLHALLGAARMMRLDAVASAVETLQLGFHRDDRDLARGGLDALAVSLAAFAVDPAVVRALALPIVSERPTMPPASSSADLALSDEIRGFFKADARTRLESIGEYLVNLAPGGDDHRSVLDAILRELHALKGSAATVGFGGLARGVHALEGAAQALRARSGAPRLETVTSLESVRSRLTLALDEEDGGDAAADSIVQRLRASGLLRERDVLSRRPTGPLPSAHPDAIHHEAGIGAEVLRVPALTVVRLSESLGEVAYVQRRLDTHVEHVGAASRGLQHAVRALQDALRKIGPARPWGAPADALALLSTVSTSLGSAVSTLDAEATALRQDAEHLSALGASASDSLKGLGRVKVGWLFDRVVPAVETAALTHDRNVRVLRGGDNVEVDRSVAERLVEPLSQLARNAVIHGIERPSDRLRAAKPAWATLRLDAVRTADVLRIAVEDDGAGIDFGAVRARADALGLLGTEREVGEAELLEMLFLPGFSTRREIDAEAGRGVGLDLVRDELRRLGGVVRARTRSGAGARFEVELVPRPIAQKVLGVRVGVARWLIPLGRVVQVSSVAHLPEGVEVIDARRFYGQAGAGTMVVLLRLDAQPEVTVGLRVDAVEGASEAVIRPLPGPLVGTVPFSAASIDGDGAVVLVLDPARAVEYARSHP